jgi:hypothetical protein
MNGDRPNEPEDVPGPPRLAAALAALHQERVFIPPQVDEAILPQAREHLGKGARRSARRRVLAPWLAAAASLAIGAWVSQTLLLHKPDAPASLAREDINGDGRVDILDALALARKIDRGTASQFDINGDNRVDRQDVDAVAARAVKLEEGS